MFFRKDRNEGDILAKDSREREDSIRIELKEENEFLKSYIKDIYNNMVEIIKNHGLVNQQHGELANLAESIKSTMETVKGISNETNELSEQLSDKSHRLNEISKNSVERSVEGEEAVSNLLGVMSSLKTQAEQSSESMSKLSERSKEITDIVKTITDIASQTNLLALNAAIEAARAGEHGRGFAIVAEEVRKLAENTTESTSTIQELVLNIQNEVDTASENSERNNSVIEKGIEMSEVVKQKIGDIVNGFEEVQKEVRVVTDTIAMQKDYIGDILSQTNTSDEILSDIHDKLINHVERASKVDENLESNLEEIKKLLEKK